MASRPANTVAATSNPGRRRVTANGVARHAVHDDRDGDPDHFQTVHYEIPLHPDDTAETGGRVLRCGAVFTS